MRNLIHGTSRNYIIQYIWVINIGNILRDYKQILGDYSQKGGLVDKTIFTCIHEATNRTVCIFRKETKRKKEKEKKKKKKKEYLQKGIRSYLGTDRVSAKGTTRET